MFKASWILLYLSLLTVGTTAAAAKGPCDRELSKTSTVPYSKVEFAVAWKKSDVTIPQQTQAWLRELIREANELFHPYFLPPEKLIISATNGYGGSVFKYDHVHGDHSIIFNEAHFSQQAIALHEYGHSLFDLRMLQDLYLLRVVQSRVQGVDYFGRKKLLHQKLSEQIHKYESISLPYNEVFADLIAGIFLSDGVCHYKTLQRCKDRVDAPEQLKERAFQLSNMTIDHSIAEIDEVYKKIIDNREGVDGVEPSKEVDAHILQAKARSHIWLAYEKHQTQFESPAEYMDLVFKVFKSEIVKRFSRNIFNKELKDRLTEEANTSLIKAFDKALNKHLKSKQP